MKCTFYTLFMLVSLLGTAVAQSGKISSKAAPFGINLAGAEFGKSNGLYNNDYAYPTTKSMDQVKSQGFKLIRIPFVWERIQPVLAEDLDLQEVEKIKKVIVEAQERGLLVILDMHNYCRRNIKGELKLINSPGLPIENIADAWMKIAEKFKQHRNIWGYGIMNEPHDMLSKTDWFDIAQAVITKIRKVDVRTTILIGGDSWSSAERWVQYSDHLKKLRDPAQRIIYEAHVYFDRDASGKYKGTYDEEKASPETGVLRVAPFVKWLKENKLRGFLGEYGVPDDDPRWLVTLDNFLGYLKQNRINGTYWAAGARWGTYRLSVAPRNGIERPQMKVLSKYLFADK